MTTPQLSRVDLRRTGRAVRFVAVLTDGTEHERLTGTVRVEDRGVLLIDAGKRHVVVSPRADGTVGSWRELGSRDDAMVRWVDAVGGRR